MRRRIPCSLILGSLVLATSAGLIAAPALAADITVKMQKATWDGPGVDLGSITISTAETGVSFKLNLHGLPPGLHGFHVHENDDCGVILMNGAHIAAGGAGSIWDPEHTGKHEGPTGTGYLGDLPVISVTPDGVATQALSAPRITNIDGLHGRSLVITAGGDTYSDSPRINGGGGSSIACGVIP